MTATKTRAGSPPTSAHDPLVSAPGSTACRWNSSRLRVFALNPKSNRSPRIGISPMAKSTRRVDDHLDEHDAGQPKRAASRTIHAAIDRS